jgi:pyruvate/2-oxoglutarate dehydrogenase complex dihydrolipoamide acyltransferase (E2) component
MVVEEQEREHRKRPRKAEGEAARAAAPATATAVRSPDLDDVMKMEEEWLKMIATPPTSEQLRQREEDLEKLLHGTWEMFRDNWIYGSIIPFDAVSKQAATPNYI